MGVKEVRAILAVSVSPATVTRFAFSAFAERTPTTATTIFAWQEAKALQPNQHVGRQYGSASQNGLQDAIVACAGLLPPIEPHAKRRIKQSIRASVRATSSGKSAVVALGTDRVCKRLEVLYPNQVHGRTVAAVAEQVITLNVSRATALRTTSVGDKPTVRGPHPSVDGDDLGHVRAYQVRPLAPVLIGWRPLVAPE